MSHDLLHALPSGRFEDVQEVGAGNHASVFSAWDCELERRVAIKIPAHETLLDVLGEDRLDALGITDGLAQLLDELGAAASQRYTLVREAKLLAAVDHPHVVPVLEVGLLDGSPVVIMPLLADGSLAERSFEGSWREPLALALELGSGLAALHRAGILHRDFKPSNVLFDRRGRPLIADLGLACRVDDEAAMADWAGTATYMAPEVRAQVSRDARDDLYAFCVITFQMFHGHLPFASDAARARGAVSRIERAGAMPEAIREILVRGLAPAPGDRWADMDSLLAALREVGAADEVAASARRWPWLAVGAAAAGLVGLLASSPVVYADSCTAVVGELDPVWNDEVAANLRGSLGTHAGSESLSAWAARYLEVRRQQCEQARADDAVRVPDGPGPCMRGLVQRFSVTVEVLGDPGLRSGLDVGAAIAELPAPERCLEQPEIPEEEALHSAGLVETRALDHGVAVALALGDDARVRESLRELAALARETNSTYAMARADYWRGRVARRAGRLAEAEAALSVAFDAANELDAPAFAAEVTLELAALALASEDTSAALAYTRLARPGLSRHRADRLVDLLELEASARLAHGESAAALGQLEQALHLRERELARHDGGTLALERTLGLLARAQLTLSLAAGALETAERGLGLVEARDGASIDDGVVFRKLIFRSILALQDQDEGALLGPPSDHPLYRAHYILYEPYILTSDPDGLADIQAWILEVLEHDINADTVPYRASPPRLTEP